MHGGEHIARILLQHHVTHLFTLTGGHISPILVGAEALGIQVTDVRDEAAAVFAADAWARRTGKVGAAAVTAGPGVTNALTALQNAKMAASPLVLFGGATATLLKGRGALQDIDQMALVRPAVKQAFQVRSLAELDSTVQNAFALAASDLPGPVFVEVPLDVLYPEELVRKWYAEAGKGKGPEAAARRWWLGRHVDNLLQPANPNKPCFSRIAKHRNPSAAHFQRAAAMLRHATKPVFVLGSSVVNDPQLVPDLVSSLGRLGVPCYLTGMARGLLAPDHPLLFRHYRKEALKGADLIVLLGVHADFRLDYGRSLNRKATKIQVSPDPSWLGKNLWPTLSAVANPGPWLLALEAVLGSPPDVQAWVKGLRGREQQRNTELRDMAEKAVTSGVDPIAVAFALQPNVGPSDAMVADGGDFVASVSYVASPKAPLSWFDPGPFGTLGVGGGFVLGVGTSLPRDAVVWGIFGDGAFGFSLAEVDSWVRHKTPVVAIIGNDAAWSQIARDQIEMLGSAAATKLAQTPYHLVAEGMGARGFHVDCAEQLPATLSMARSIALGGVPVVVNVVLAPSDFRKGSLSV